MTIRPISQLNLTATWKHRATLSLFVTLLPLFWACKQRPLPAETRFQLLSPDQSGIHFTNRVTPNDSLNLLDFNYFYNGGGVAVGDLNQDGLPDLYFSGNMTSSRLYLNRGQMHFEDITEPANAGTRNWATGVAMVDLNQDGRLDIYVCFSGYRDPGKRANQLFINQGNDAKGIPSFREMARAYGLDDTGYSTQAAFFDYDRDGDLDVYVATVDQNNLNPNLPRPKVTDGSAPSTDRLFRNNGVGSGGHPTFSNVSKEAGIRMEGYGLGLAISDLNQDGWPDIYVSNDFIFNDLLYLNNQDGTFTESAARCLKHQSRFAMGNDVADINNDGLVDITVLDMLPNDNQRQKLMNTGMNYDLFRLAVERGYQPQYSRNTLQLRNGTSPQGTPIFSEIGYLAGIYQTDWSWSALLADYDNDGFRDLFVTNGIPKDITDSDFIMYRDSKVQAGNYDPAQLKQTLMQKVEELPGVRKPDFLFRNNGDLTFTDESKAWGIDLPACSNGAAYADLDNDGDLDLVVNNLDEVASIFRNRSDKQVQNHFLRVQLKGPAGNQAGLGAKVTIRYDGGGKIQFAEQSPYRGFQSSVEPILHFGLGKDSLLNSVEIVWPDGKYQSLRNVKANQVLTLSYQHAVEKPLEAAVVASPLFREMADKDDLHFRHVENEFIDFKWEPLLPQKNSQYGPGMAVGDVNGDGLDDFYVGGPSKIAGRLFLQKPDGKFDDKPFPDPGYEDQGALLFDADNDGDLDLYVVSGGNEYNAYSAAYQDRLYRNDGKGHFERDLAALPPLTASGSCVTAADYDRDGDLDLFVGGRLVPGKYPLPARSYLLRNDGSRFTDVTKTICPSLSQLGLVTTALWTDFDNDQRPDLIVAGEWMPITVFHNTGKQLINETAVASLANALGWWNSLNAGDFDNDGDMDYVAGNLGLNSRYKASETQPVSLFAKDFDGNGRLDPLLSFYLEGKPFLAYSRDALTDQMVGWRKRFPRYADYANASLTELLPENDTKDAYQLKATYFESAYVENLGQGRFRLQPLPIQAQFAPVYGTQTFDCDDDGNLDILLTGNSYATEFVTGWYDASVGLVLKGDGKGHFIPLTLEQSGFLVEGDAKSLVMLKAANGTLRILAGINSGVLKVFAPTSPVIHTLPLPAMAAWAEITMSDGRKTRQEFSYGSGYLSQSSRFWQVPPGAKSAVLYDYAGKSTPVKVNQAHP